MTLRLVVPAVAVSVFLHGLGFGWIGAPEEVILEGGAPATAARLGNDFEDLAAGTVAPVVPEEAKVSDSDITAPVDTTEQTDDVAPDTEPPVDTPGRVDDVAPEVEQSVDVDDVQKPTSEPKTEAPNPEPTQSIAVDETVVIAAPSALVTEGVIVAPDARAVEPSPAPTLSAPATVTPTAPVAAALPPPTADRPSAVSPAPAPSPDTLEVIEGEQPIVAQQADADTPRPLARPERQPEQQRRQPTPQQAGNAERDAVRGSNEGRENATSSSSSQTNRPAAQQGNSAAASNYPGLVSRRLSRVRLPRGLPRGSGVVEFVIAQNGGVASVRIVRSSGNQRLDAEAMRLARRAAPFPPPPPGAQTRIRFPFESTGR